MSLQIPQVEQGWPLPSGMQIAEVLAADLLALALGLARKRSLHEVIDGRDACAEGFVFVAGPEVQCSHYAAQSL